MLVGNNISGAVVRVTSGFDASQDVLGFGALPSGVTADTSVPGQITFTGDATTTQYRNLLRSVTYRNTSDNPSATPRVFSFTVTDLAPSSQTSAAATRTVTVGAVNDAPVFTTPGGLIPVFTTATVALAGISVGDPDLNAGSLAVTVSVPTGTLDGTGFAGAPGTSLTVTGDLATVNAALATLTYTATATGGTVAVALSASDGGSSGSGGTQVGTATQNVLVNAAPVIGGAGTTPYAENAAATPVAPALTVTDDAGTIGGATVVVTSGFSAAEDVLTFGTLPGGVTADTSVPGQLTFSGTATDAQYQTLLRSVSYANSSDNPSTPNRVFTFTVTDAPAAGAARTASAFATVTVGAVNDAPVNTAPTPPTFAAGEAAAVPGLAVADVDLNAGSLTVTVAVNPGEGTFSGAGFSGSGTNAVSVTGDLATVTAALAGLQYTPPVATGDFTATMTTSDGGATGAGGTQTDTDTITLRVRQRPVVTPTAGPVVFTENDAALAVDPTLTLSDPDSTSLVSAVVRVSAGFAPAEDVLGFDALVLPPTVTADTSVAGQITFTGTATLAEYEALLQSVTYQNTSDDPSAATRTFEFTVADDPTALASLPQTRDVLVVPVNDAPTVTALVAVSNTLEDQGVDITGISIADIDAGTGDLVVTILAPDGAVSIPTPGGVAVQNDDTGLVTLTGTLNRLNAALALIRFTPGADFNGFTNIIVVVDDQGNTGGGSLGGGALSSVIVQAVNDVPVFTPGADQAVNEDAGPQTVTAWATGVSAGPADEAGQHLTFLVDVSDPTLFSVVPSISATGDLTFTPAQNAFGTATVTVRLMDDGGTDLGGADTTPARTFTITIQSVNDAPAFVKGPDVSVGEDAGNFVVPVWAIGLTPGPLNEAGQHLTFEVMSVTNAGLFAVAPAVSPTGALSFTPTADLSGTSTVTVRLRDDGGTARGGVDASAPQTFTITVRPVNDAPTFDLTLPPGGRFTVNQLGQVVVPGFATNMSAGPADEAGQTTTFEVISNNQALYAALPTVDAAGTLRFTPANNVTGTSTVRVRLHDDGGTADGGVDFSAEQVFFIDVSVINDAPSFTAGPNQTVNEDAGPQTVAGWATNVSAGPPDEAGQALAFQVVTGNPALFATPPAISPTGTLTYTPAADANGSTTIRVKLRDDGGSDNGGVDTSAEQTFTITILPVNDAPTFVIPAAPVTATGDGAVVVVPTFATSFSTGPANEAGQTVQVFQVTTDNPGLFAGAPQISVTTGELIFTPAAGAAGAANVTVRLMDSGGTANGGVDLSAPQTFLIQVAPVQTGPPNTPPVANADQLAIPVGTNYAVPVDVLANDTTDAGETLTITAVTQPSNGTAAISGGRIVYSPRAGFHGTDSFGYTITDGNGGTASALVTVSVTAPLPTPVDVVAVGADVGSRVRVVRTDRQEILADFEAFPGFQGGVTVAMGDFTGDGVPDLAVGAGPGGGPVVKLYDGALLSRGPDAALITTFNAFLPSLRGGVTVAAGDVNGDGRADLVVGAGPGGGPHVKVVSATELKNLDGDGLPRNLLASFFAYAAGFTGGVRVAAGDVTGDGRADVVTGAGIGGTPHVKIYDGTSFAEINSFYAYAARFAGGVAVGVGDLDGDGIAEIVTGAGPGGGPHVKVIDARTLQERASFFAFDTNSTTGVDVTVRGQSGGSPLLIAGSGDGDVRAFAAPDFARAPNTLIDLGFLGGVDVG